MMLMTLFLSSLWAQPLTLNTRESSFSGVETTEMLSYSPESNSCSNTTTTKYIYDQPVHELKNSSEDKENCEPLRQAWLIESKLGKGCREVQLGSAPAMYAFHDLRLTADCLCVDNTEVVYPVQVVYRKVNDLTLCQEAFSEDQKREIESALDAPIFQSWYWKAFASLKKAIRSR